MKKTISLMLALASISSMGVSAMAANDTGEPMVIAPAPSVVATAQRQFVVNGKAMQLDSYTTENGTLMVPVRALAEALGFKVTWNNGEVNINDGEMQCDLRIGEENYFVYTAIKDAIGMSAPFTLGSAPFGYAETFYLSRRSLTLLASLRFSASIRQTLDEIDRDAFQGAVDALTGAHRIYILGVRSSSALANFLGFYFNLLFDNVTLVHTNSVSEIFEQVLRVGPGDVLFGISFPRYSKRTLSAMQYARDRGAKVIALTDSQLSPLARVADHLLLARSDMASFVDSLVAPLSVINALIVAVGMSRRDEIEHTFNKLESIWEKYDVYEKPEDDTN